MKFSISKNLERPDTGIHRNVLEPPLRPRTPKIIQSGAHLEAIRVTGQETA